MDFNRILWITIFLLGSLSFFWLEWQSDFFGAMAMFLLTSLWSAACAIAYSIIDWVISRSD